MENTRELVLRIADAEAEAITAVNTIMQSHGIPCFLFEPIVDKIHRQLTDGKATELAAAKEREMRAGQEGAV